MEIVFLHRTPTKHPIATIVFLAAQVRANSAAVQNSTIQAQAAAQSEWARQLTVNPDLFELYRKGLSGKTELSARDLHRFDLVLNQSFTEVQAVYRQCLNGGFDEEIWQAQLRTQGAICNTPGGLASWTRQKNLLDRRFQAELDSYLASEQDRDQQSATCTRTCESFNTLTRLE